MINLFFKKKTKNEMTSPIILLTGCSRGLGFAILKNLLVSNCRVVCLSKSSALPQEIINEYQDQIAYFSIDLSTAYKEENSKPLSTFIQEITKKWSDFKIHAFIHNAGVLSIGPADQLAGYNLLPKNIFLIWIHV